MKIIDCELKFPFVLTDKKVDPSKYEGYEFRDDWHGILRTSPTFEVLEDPEVTGGIILRLHYRCADFYTRKDDEVVIFKDKGDIHDVTPMNMESDGNMSFYEFWKDRVVNGQIIVEW